MYKQIKQSSAFSQWTSPQVDILIFEFNRVVQLSELILESSSDLN